jgi:exodeoxyribonuclease VII small subunit
MPREKVETFEKLYARLEATVGKLEDGGLSLEDAIALYEEGMTLARQCQERLDEAEQKVTKLKESFSNVPPRADPNGSATSDFEAVQEEIDIEDEPFG